LPNKISAPQLAAYSALSLPLTMAALPVYVHAPKLYADLGVPLAWLGYAMLLLRAGDAFIDPLLGRISDAMHGRKRLIALAALPLFLGIWALFAPQVTGLSLQTVFVLSLVLTYIGFSAATIAYNAWGAEWSEDVHERTRITTWREAAGLIGVLVASALPVVLVEQFGLAQGYQYFGSVFGCVLLVFGLITLWGARELPKLTLHQEASFGAIMADRSFKRLLWVFAFNGIAAAIPATLVLFFIADVVQANDWQKEFLIAYFIAGALAAPAWMALSRRIGKRRTWALSMVVAVVTFCWAYFLGPGDRLGFLAVCVLSGIALGADLTLPPSMLADVIGKSAQPQAGGGYFGVWTMVNKLNLAIAAGLALPALAWLGYVPNAAQAKTHALSIAYCVLPCVLKVLALVLLMRMKDRDED
jgi:glycoside/pentoside/hexuronide:cation symporter, GPH family